MRTTMPFGLPITRKKRENSGKLEEKSKLSSFNLLSPLI